ncbi:MAG: thiamine pyrophosphate-binding protein [Pseudomonadota bacterium]
MKTYEALAKAFRANKVTTCFALLGDANMHWAGALDALGVSFIYPRHEHAAVAAATAYARSTGRVGCASVTCGPGLTQVMTILPIAVRAKVPLVVFAGEAPIRKAWYNQGIDHAPFVEACGAEYRSLQDPATMIAEVNRAFADALADGRPIVLGAPFDLQQDAFEGPEPSPTPVEAATPKVPESAAIAEAAHWIAEAKRPVLIAGFGAVGAKDACVGLAERAGALLATTLPAKGLFRGHEYCLGVAGGYASPEAKAIFKEADLVIGVGARLASHTFNSGSLTPDARVIHIDLDPQEQVQGRKAADLLIAADAQEGARALAAAITAQTGWRTDEAKAQAKAATTLPDETETPDGALHPMAAVKQLAAIIPPEAHVVNTSGHCAYYTAQMNDHPQSHYTVMRDFGAIGNGTSFALGIAAAYPDRPVVLIDGDGSALMHIQELETMERHGLQVLVIVLNDGAYGSEVHKLKADGVSLAGSVFGRTQLAEVAKGFGLGGATVTSLDDMSRAAFEAFLASGKSALWDIHISGEIASPQILKAHKAVHA